MRTLTSLRSVRRPAAVVVAIIAALFGAVGGDTGAGAASPSRQGWWKVGLPVADVGIGGLGDLRDPQGLDVPDGGLLVQGGPSVDQPAAYAAVAFDLGTATVSGPLRLVVAPNTVSVPGSKLIACPLNSASFTPADGGAVANGPPYTCSRAVPATVDAGTYVFDVAGLGRGETLAVAILPSAPTDRVVFARPGDGALAVSESSGAADGTIPLEPIPDVAGSNGVGVTAPLPSDLGGVGSVAAPSVVPSVDTPTSSSPPPAARALPAARPAAAHRSRTSYAPYLIVTLLALAAVLWVGAGSGTGEEP